MFPNPSTLTTLARIRQAELVAEADRCRLAQYATDVDTAHRGWSVLAALAMALALPFVAHFLG